MSRFAALVAAVFVASGLTAGAGPWPARAAVALAASTQPTAPAPTAPMPLAGAAPPTVSDAYPVSDPVSQGAPQGREWVDVVAGADGYLAVWSDTRMLDFGGHVDVYAARIADDGTVLDPAGIRVTSDAGEQGMPRVAWSGTHYLIVWTDARDSAQTGSDIYAARITADGDVLDPDGVVIAATTWDESGADVVWNGSAFVVAYTKEAGNGSNILIERLDANLETIGPHDLFFAAASYDQLGVRLALDGTTTVGIYTDGRDQDIGEGWNVYMNRLTVNGEMLDDGFAIATGAGDQLAADIAGSPSGLLATWVSRTGTPSSTGPLIRGQRYIGATAVDPVLEISEDGDWARVAWGPDGYLVGWMVTDGEGDGDTLARHVSLQGVLADPFVVTDGDESEDLDGIAGGDAGYLVGAVGRPFTGGGGTQILGVRVNGGERLDEPPIPIATAPREQGSPIIVEAGATRVAVWSERDETTGWDVRMGRLTEGGDLVDGVGIPIAAGPDDERWPSAAWNGSRLLVTWFDSFGDVGRTMARPMNVDGSPAGPAVELGQEAIDQRPAVATAGGRFVATWTHHLVGDVHEAMVRPFDSAGTPTGPAAVITTPIHAAQMDVARLGTGFIAAWEGLHVEAKRLTAFGVPVDASPIQISPPSEFGHSPGIASSGDQALITWIPSSTEGLRATRVSTAGALLDAPPIDLAGAQPSVLAGSVGWNGLTYQAAWWNGGDSVTLEGAEVNRLGEILHTGTLPTAANTFWGDGLSVGSGTGGRVAIGMRQVDLGTHGGGTYRALVRFVDVDRGPLSGTGVAIAGGAAATKGTSVVVSVPASNAHLVALSNDGVAWTTRPWAPAQPWTLTPADGLKTVRVKWRDALGNWSAVKSDTIVLDTVAPTASSVTSGFLSNVTLSAGRPTVKVAWAGADTTSGIARYELRSQTDGGAWTVVANSLTGKSLNLSPAPGHTYRYAVRAIDRAGNVSAFAYGSTFRLTGHQQTSAAIKYSGTWSNSTSIAYWGGTARFATAQGARASFTFTGRTVAWLSLKSYNRGKANIYVNGAYAGSVDLYAASTQGQRVVWSRSWSTSASRTIEIRVVGTAGRARVDVDGFFTGS